MKAPRGELEPRGEPSALGQSSAPPTTEGTAHPVDCGHAACGAVRWGRAGGSARVSANVGCLQDETTIPRETPSRAPATSPEWTASPGLSELSLLSELAEVGYRRAHVVAEMPAPTSVLRAFERLAHAPRAWREDLVVEFDVFQWTRASASDRLFANAAAVVDASTFDVDTLQALVSHVRRAFGLLRVVVPEARFRFELRRVDDDGCCKFHVDHHAARLLFTYVGAGTQWVDDDAVDRVVVDDPPADVELANAAIVRDLDAIRTLPPGQVLVMSGTGLVDTRVPPTVHRSPPKEASPPPHRRFVLTITALANRVQREPMSEAASI